VFIPAMGRRDQLDGFLGGDDGDAIVMAQKLARQGLGVGISSGANLLAALMAQERLGPEAVVVTIFSDDNKKYLSTDLMREEPVKPGFLSSELELVGFSTVKRVCDICHQQEAAALCAGC